MVRYFYAIATLLFISNFTTAQTPKHIKAGYSLLWEDNFNGYTLDTSKWSYRALDNKRVFGLVSKETIHLDRKGHLAIEVTKKDSTYLIGQISTQKSFLTTYGYFECRTKLNSKLGPHTSFWLQSPTVGKTDNNTAVNGAELDIFEYHINKGISNIYHNIHWNGYGANHKTIGTVTQIKGIEKGFHTFGMEWTPTEYIFYIDGKETWRTTEAISHRSQYMILSTELTGWGGDFIKTTFPDKILFDYVKVYKKINFIIN